MVGGVWQVSLPIPMHDAGITGLSWGPPYPACLLQAESHDYMQNEKAFDLVPKRLVTAGMDKKVKIWQENNGEFVLNSELKSKGKDCAHDDWVRDVAWCNNVGTQRDIIATCGEDNELKIWIWSPKSSKDWQLAWSHEFKEPVWKCSWSQVGFMLGVSTGDNKTYVFR